MLTSLPLSETPDWEIGPTPNREQLLEQTIQMYVRIGELYRKMGRILEPEIERRNKRNKIYTNQSIRKRDNTPTKRNKK